MQCKLIEAIHWSKASYEAIFFPKIRYICAKYINRSFICVYSVEKQKKPPVAELKKLRSRTKKNPGAELKKTNKMDNNIKQSKYYTKIAR